MNEILKFSKEADVSSTCLVSVCAVAWEQNSLLLLLALWNLCVTGFVQVMQSLESHEI